MPGRPPTRRAHLAEQGATQRMNLPTVVPNRGLPKHRRQNRRNKRHRSTASSSCLLPVGPVARRDGGGGHRAREFHASSFSKDRTSVIAIAAGTPASSCSSVSI